MARYNWDALPKDCKRVVKRQEGPFAEGTYFECVDCAWVYDAKSVQLEGDGWVCKACLKARRKSSW